MKPLKSIGLATFLSLMLLLIGCSLDSALEVDTAAQALPAEVQAAIDAGTVANINLSDANRGTGTISGNPVIYPSNFNPSTKRYTPAVRINLDMSDYYSKYDTYVFYINSMPAIVFSKSDSAHIIGSKRVAAFIDRPTSAQTYSVVAYALSSAGYIRATGGYTYIPKLNFGFFTINGTCSTSNPPPYTDNQKIEYYHNLKAVRITIAGGSAAYYVLKQGVWVKDSGGYAGGCSDYEIFGLKAIPTGSPSQYYSGASKVGIAYRVCDTVTHYWSDWCRQEIGYPPSLKPNALTPNGNGMIGLQVSLYMC